MLIVPTRRAKLMEETAIARTIGMPNNEGIPDQPVLGEVGGAKL